MKKKQKYYVVVDGSVKKDNNFIEGAFPLTEDGRIKAEEYAKNLSKLTKRKYVIKEKWNQ